MLDESKAESFVSDVIQKNDGGRRVKDFLALPQGIGSFSTVFSLASWCI